jgi:hypothetical protein
MKIPKLPFQILHGSAQSQWASASTIVQGVSAGSHHLGPWRLSREIQTYNSHGNCFYVYLKSISKFIAFVVGPEGYLDLKTAIRAELVTNVIFGLSVKSSQITNHHKFILHCAKSNSTVKKRIFFVEIVQLKHLRVFKPAGLNVCIFLFLSVCSFCLLISHLDPCKFSGPYNNYTCHNSMASRIF